MSAGNSLYLLTFLLYGQSVWLHDTVKKKNDDKNLGDASYLYFTNIHLWVPSVTSDWQYSSR